MRLLQKFLTRDASLFAMEKWYEGLVEKNKEFFGTDFPENVFIFRQGTVEFYRDREKNSKELPLKLSEWAKLNRDKMKITYQSLVEAVDFIEEIDKKKYLSLEQVIIDLNKMGNLFAAGFKGIITTFWFPIWQDSFKKQGVNLFDDKFIKEAEEWRSKTESFFDESVEIIFLLLNKIAKIKDWDGKLLKFIFYKELINSIKQNKLPEEKLQKRRDNVFAFIRGEVFFEEEVGIKLKNIGFELEKEEILKNVKELKGNIANGGIAKGKIKLVFNRDQINKVKNGDILVAPMTTPWYVPAMKKAAGFITDEGGITCHAAIMAREMNKPCIIGTKIATKVFKDGDEVVMNVEEGIVRKVKGF